MQLSKLCDYTLYTQLQYLVFGKLLYFWRLHPQTPCFRNPPLQLFKELKILDFHLHELDLSHFITFLQQLAIAIPLYSITHVASYTILWYRLFSQRVQRNIVQLHPCTCNLLFIALVASVTNCDKIHINAWCCLKPN